MSAYIDDVKEIIEAIEEVRKKGPLDGKLSLRLAINIKLTAEDILCVGEKDFREFLADKGQKIIRLVGDGDFYPINPAPNMYLVERIIDKVYERLQLELVPESTANS
ncbi:hypothetical protein JANAI62_35740 [Jannaschia pagri]|uniref:Uncharacterized protein n=1 Tax=Jannaschia pagri TaxID=2829797 RepID=A0ABQ4NRA6_9RHOB|nr:MULTISPECIES: hypothetical protein [unclassified Jannaschia]GIT93142.1 hypothetical protein JANAI61_36000 [Jannaschia sp. AI_61]GIT96951.1 hypothetical protein JANAI62_35740 [Jannaschia sp. AI_62]